MSNFQQTHVEIQEHTLNRLSGADELSGDKNETEIVTERRSCCGSDPTVEVDLECGLDEMKVHVARFDRDCRICYLSMDAADHETGLSIELGCSCKNDLAAAHKQCAETWFKIKGDKTCEICGSIAHNITYSIETESVSDSNNSAPQPPATVTQNQTVESRTFWKGHRFLNFLLAAMVFAFVISWLFHFNVPS